MLNQALACVCSAATLNTDIGPGKMQDYISYLASYQHSSKEWDLKCSMDREGGGVFIPLMFLFLEIAGVVVVFLVGGVYT